MGVSESAAPASARSNADTLADTSTSYSYVDMLCIAANALAFSPPTSLSRREMLSSFGVAAGAAMVQFPSIANAADKPAYLLTDEEKEAAKKAAGIKIETESERLERLGLKQASPESIDSTYKVNNVNPSGVNTRKSTDPNPNQKIKDKYGF